MKKNSKEYVCKDVNMLVAAKTVAWNFKNNISELNLLNAKWDEAYADYLIARLEDTLNNHLGCDIKKELRDTTLALTNLMIEVKNDFSVFKRLVRRFYIKEPAKRDEIFKVLGFKQYSKARVIGTQNGIIKLLFDFKTNLTVALRQELVSKSIIESLLDNIIANATKFEDINNVQEVLKGTTSERSNSRQALYNSIYREVSSICIIASSLFKTSEVKQAMFNFSKIAHTAYRNQKTELEINIAAEALKISQLKNSKSAYDNTGS